MECKHKILLKSGILVPCGKCPTCYANLRQEWIFRLKQEYLDSVFSIFVTLTYDDEHLPDDRSVNKKDIQLFHKRLRKHFPSKDLRFYLVSEYGDHTFRPHYHGLYFFKNKYDLKFLYDIFEKSWSLGFIKFGAVEEGSIVYCTKYCLKHSSTPPGCKETFRLVSKMNGGLGYYYLTKMSDYHIQNDQFAFVADSGQLCRMPRYYRDKLSLFYKTSLSDLDKYDKECEINQKALNTFNQKFAVFCRSHNFDTLKDAQQAFNDYMNSIRDNQDDLIIKHCKKQKF